MLEIAFLDMRDSGKVCVIGREELILLSGAAVGQMVPSLV